LELDVASIKERLDSIEYLLANQQSLGHVEASAEFLRPATFTAAPITCGEGLLLRKSTYDTNELPNIPGFPLMVIRNKAFMDLVGLSQNLAANLATLERSAIRDIEFDGDRYDSLKQHKALVYVWCASHCIDRY